MQDARLAVVAETTAIDAALDFLTARGLPPATFECRMKHDVALVELLCPPTVEAYRVLGLGAELAALPATRGVAVVRLRRREWLDGSRFDREVVASWTSTPGGEAPGRVAA
jgi:hypothetical protein